MVVECPASLHYTHLWIFVLFHHMLHMLHQTTHQTSSLCQQSHHQIFFAKSQRILGFPIFISIQLGMHDGSGNPDHEGFHFLFSDQVIMNTYSNKGCVIPCAAFIWFTMFCIIDGICIFNAFAIYCLNMFAEPTIPPYLTIVPTLGVNSKLLSFKTCVFKTSLVME